MSIFLLIAKLNSSQWSIVLKENLSLKKVYYWYYTIRIISNFLHTWNKLWIMFQINFIPLLQYDEYQ